MNSTNGSKLGSRSGALVALWLIVGFGLGSGTAISRIMTSPLDDRNPADQRPGFLDSAAAAYPAPPVGPGLPPHARRSVIFFARPPLVARLAASLAGDPDLAKNATEIIVVCGESPTLYTRAPVQVIVEPVPCQSAQRYRMRSPRDDGAPVGYAVVSASGLVRYTTLDPEVARHLSEVDTLVRAVA